MDLEIINLANNDQKDYTQFIRNVESNLITNINSSEIIENNEWVEEVLFTIPYIVKAFENANKNLITEEEILKMELIKKVSVDSIKHLTKHTNFITKFDEENGDVIPEKLLNSNKEESYETYENRFLYSLVLLIGDFMIVRERAKKNRSNDVKGKNKQQALYEGKTKFRREKIKFKFEYTAERLEIAENDKNIDDMFLEIEERLKSIKATTLFKLLSSKRILLVKSPLKMTNVLLKNVNYQYAVKLWNYLQDNFDLKNETIEQNNKIDEKGTTKKLIDQGFLLNYIIFNKVNKPRYKARRKAVLTAQERNEATDVLIEQLIQLNPELAEQELQKMIARKYIKYKRIWTVSLKPIENRFKTEIEKYKNKILKNKL